MTNVTKVSEVPEDMQKAIYIVSDVRGYDVEMVNFFQLLKVGKKEAKKLKLTGILKENRIGEDGKEVSFALGELVQATMQDSPQGLATHFANVGPSDERGYTQWAWAKSMLFSTRWPNQYSMDKPDDEVLGTFGQFDPLGSKSKKVN